jgi:hypothetical protein
MNAVKKYMGLVWMALAIGSYYILLKTAIEQINKVGSVDAIIQWGIFAIIFLPIAIGLLIFGWLAFQGLYDHLPESSKEVED